VEVPKYILELNLVMTKVDKPRTHGRRLLIETVISIVIYRQ
jgi:hypothetical protein